MRPQRFRAYDSASSVEPITCGWGEPHRLLNFSAFPIAAVVLSCASEFSYRSHLSSQSPSRPGPPNGRGSFCRRVCRGVTSSAQGSRSLVSARSFGRDKLDPSDATVTPDQARGPDRLEVVKREVERSVELFNHTADINTRAAWSSARTWSVNRVRAATLKIYRG